MAGCGTTGNSSAPATASPSVAAAPSCRQQYETWKHGPAKAPLGKLKSTLGSVQSQADAEDFPGITSALKRAGAAAHALAALPPPGCADPKGYYGKMLARIKASGDNARSASGLGGILLALAPLKSVPGIEKKLGRELDRTIGKGR